MCVGLCLCVCILWVAVIQSYRKIKYGALVFCVLVLSITSVMGWGAVSKICFELWVYCPFKELINFYGLTSVALFKFAKSLTHLKRFTSSSIFHNAVFHPYAMEKGFWLIDFFLYVTNFGYMY